MVLCENSDSEASFQCDLKTEYTVSERTKEYEDLPYSRTYGITACFTNSDGNRIEKTISDVSLKKETVENLIKTLTENKVSFYHFEAVVEDTLFEETFI